MDIVGFCSIVLSIIVIRLWWKRNMAKELSIRLKPDKPVNHPFVGIVDIQRKEVDTKRQKYIAELRKQGYTDELIAVILPVINNDN